MGKFRIITLNVRGLKNARKRKMVYEFLLHYNFDVCLLQEVHLKDEGDIDLFTEEWRGGESAWSIGGGTRDWGRSVMWKQKYKDKGKLHVNTGKGDGCRCGKKWNAKPDNKRVRTCGSKVEKRTTLKNGYLFYDKKKIFWWEGISTAPWRRKNPPSPSRLS